ncbi:Uncharacterised protein [Acidipropionibacterium jensenii]|uniref:Uncharacterized protein n=2 Tax=Acidipropionibacterium jensenii TaxID=1749 RepID=A0A3S4USC5_9ACTN|nr:Uncharacterised protein [Acidipropionibacterium jensenii]
MATEKSTGTYYRIHAGDRDHAGICDKSQWDSREIGGGRWVEDPETGELVEDVRYGVSACESIEDLAAYVAQTGVGGDNPVIVEFEAELADDDDHDADLGAVLTWPTRIVGVYDEGDATYDAFDQLLDEALGWTA